METWDLYTAQEVPTGKTVTRGEVIPEGYYHLVSEILLRHTDGDYLLMKRSAAKTIYPGAWEATAGGSALAGENAMLCARRELREETGIDCDNFRELGSMTSTESRTIYHSFLAICDCPKDSVKLQKGETEDYRWLSEEEFREFWQTGNSVPIQKRRLLPWLINNGYLPEGTEIPVTAAELVDLGICPTCYDRSHNFALYGDPKDTTLYENDLFTCVLIGGPRAPGHTCIISKAHYKDMMDIPDTLCAAVYLFAKKAMNALKKVYNAESVYLCTMCDGPMNHFHVQLIPRYAGEKRGSKNFVKPRQEYVHEPEKVEALRKILR